MSRPALREPCQSSSATTIAPCASIALGNDLLACVFRKYYRNADSPRVFPPEAADAWFQREVLHGIDGVVFYLPPDDDVRGWDYPRQKQFLDERGIPNMLIREEVNASEVSTALAAQFEMFLGKLAARLE